MKLNSAARRPFSLPVGQSAAFEFDVLPRPPDARPKAGLTYHRLAPPTKPAARYLPSGFGVSGLWLKGLGNWAWVWGDAACGSNLQAQLTQTVLTVLAS